ncbi:MAG: condensation domain-containing protein, partial [Candidatus Binatia bacterium]
MESIEDRYPLSPLQHGMLFHSLYAPRSGVYIEQLDCGLHERLDVPAFKRAWERTAQRHSILRTAFRWEGLDEPVQEVRRRVTLPWEEHDLRRLSPEQQEAELAAYVKVDRERGFELTQAPLMRLTLFRLDEVDYRCIWTCHHTLLDGRSYIIVLKEVFSFYEAFCAGRDLQLDDPIPYRAYIDWLRRQDPNGSKSFWRNTLKDFVTPVTLGVERSRSADSGQEPAAFGKQAIRLSATLTGDLRSFARQHDLTPNTVFQGAWALLLNRYSGREDVVFGATRAGRYGTVERAGEMVGLFINTLPVRVAVPGDMGLLPWLKELRAQWRALRDYEHSSLVKVQEWS